MGRFKSVLSGLAVVISVTLLGACGMLSDWETMSIDGATVSFEMPKPIKMIQDDKSGMVLYAAQNSKDKLSFKVGIVKRNLDQDQAQGLTDDTVLQNFSTRILQISQQQFAQIKVPTTPFKFNGNFQTPTGNGAQYEGTAGKAIVLNRFYINKLGLYWVEATTQDPNNKDFRRFLDSFKP